jgi:hypothetical protein
MDRPRTTEPDPAALRTRSIALLRLWAEMTDDLRTGGLDPADRAPLLEGLGSALHEALAGWVAGHGGDEGAQA